MSNNTKTTNEIETSNTAPHLEPTIPVLTDGLARVSAVVEQSGAKLNEGMENSVKTAETIVRFGQGNIEAVTKSTQIWIAGVQDLSKQVAASLKASTQETMSNFKALGTVKSLKEAIDLQTGFARGALEKLVAESARLTQASVKLTGVALAPLSARVQLAVQASGKAG